MKILVVCTGNTCRSPMAEGIFKYIAENNNLDIEVKSAGINAFDGDSVSRQSILSLQNIGLDISNYKSTLVHDKLMEESDLILTMTKFHKDVLIRKYPKEKDKIFLLNEFAFNINKDVDDPFGGSVSEYDVVRNEIYKAVERVIEKIGKR